MKSITTIPILLAILFFVSCAERPTNMVTVVNPDGTCYREFVQNVTPAFLMGDSIEKTNPFPVDIDSTCRVSWQFRGTGWHDSFPVSRMVIDSVFKSVNQKLDSAALAAYGSEEFCLRVRKEYSSVEEMSANFHLKKSHQWSRMKVNCELDKQFRWFYTYYHYRETYPKMHTNFDIPISKYMGDDEARFWFTGKPDLLAGMNGIEARECLGNMEDRYNDWFAHNLWRMKFREMLKNYNRIANQPVGKRELEQLCDSIYKSKVSSPDFKMDEVLNLFFKTTAFSELWKGEESPMKKYEDHLFNEEFISYFPKSFNYKLLLPGKVLQPGNALMHGDTLVWKLTAHRMFPGDYTLEAESRKPNVWAFVLTGIVLVVAVGSFFWKPKK